MDKLRKAVHNDYRILTASYIWDLKSFEKHVAILDAEIKDIEAKLKESPVPKTTNYGPTGGAGNGERMSEEEHRQYMEQLRQEDPYQYYKQKDLEYEEKQYKLEQRFNWRR